MSKEKDELLEQRLKIVEQIKAIDAEILKNSTGAYEKIMQRNLLIAKRYIIDKKLQNLSNHNNSLGDSINIITLPKR